MKTCGFLAATLFGALAVAAPVNKRDTVWVTQTDVDIITMDVTMTVWAGASATEVPSAATVQDHHYRPSSASSSVSAEPTTSASTSSSVYVAPTTSSSSSVYVAPTTSSTSVYVAPTTSSTPVYVAPTISSTSVYVAPTTFSTSVYVAPTTSSTSVYVAPTTTEAPSSTYVAPSSTSSSAAATSSSTSSSGSGIAAKGTSYTGDLTWYETGEGACGWDNTASDHIVAISKDIFDSTEYATANPNSNPLCGRQVSITGVDGSQYTAKVVDRCVGCEEGDLDLSEDFFNTVTSNGNGRVSDITWTWE